MTSKERENFLRNAILVVDHSKAALVSLVELDLQNKGQTFEQFVNTNQHEIYHLYNSSWCCQCLPGHRPPRSTRILHQSQMELLFDRSPLKLPCHNTGRRPDDFCCSMAKSGLCTDVLDLTSARCLLVNFCNDIFWFSCLQFQSITFEDFVYKNKHELYHLWQYNVPCCQCPSGYTFPTNYSVLDQNDWMQMFNAVLLPCTNHRKRPSSGSMHSICSFAAAPSLTPMNLNSSVNRIILQYCCTLRMDVETLVQIRNQDYGHAKEGIMSDADYNASVVKIERCILDIAKVCNKETQFKQKLREAKDGALDQTLFTQYQNNLMETLTRQADIHQSVADLAPTINEIGNKIAEKSEKIPKLMDEYAKKSYDYQEQLMERFNQKLVKVKNQTHMEIDCHVEEQTFVETNAVRKCKEWMNKKDVFVIIGNEGSGKSRIGLEILRQFGKTEEDFDLLKLTNIQQVKDIITDERKTAVLIDDAFSSKQSSNDILNNCHALDLLNARKCKGNVKIIFTVDSSKMNSFEYLLVSHRLFQNNCKIDLNSQRFCMSDDEKAKLLFKFCKKHGIIITWNSSPDTEGFSLDGRTVYEIAKTDPFIGYPKLCFMFTSSKSFLELGISFFKHPNQSLMTEINSLRDSTDNNPELNISYALLVYTLLNSGCLEINEIDLSKLETIIESCGNSQRRRLFDSKVRKIADQMNDRFLKQDTQTMVYHFKHPMIYEALAISYLEVNPSEVISVLNFDLIIGSVKLFANFGKQEISLIITEELFGYLTKRLFTILEKDYKIRTAEFIKRLCSSSIIVQNNPAFISLLMEEFNNYTPKDIIEIQIEGKTDQISFFLSSSLLWHLIQKHDVDKPIATVLNFIENDIKDKQHIDKVLACKKVVLASFYYLCENDDSDLKLELIYGLIENCKLECSYDYSMQKAMTKGNYSAVSFLLSKFSTEIDITEFVFEIEDIRKLWELILQTFHIELFNNESRTNILEILFRSLSPNLFNFRKSINTACNRHCKDLVTGILNLSRTLSFDTSNIVNAACSNKWEEALQILLNKKLCNENQKRQIFNAACKHGTEAYLKWILLKVDKDCLDVQELFLHEFRCENYVVVKNFILKLQNYLEMEMMIKNLVTQFNLPIIRLLQWEIDDTDNKIHLGNTNNLQSLYIVQWINERFPDLQNDVRNTVYKTINDSCDNSDEILQWLNENTKGIVQPVTSLLDFSCKNDLQQIVKWILQTFDHQKFNLHHLIIDTYNTGYYKTAEVIIGNVDLNKIDVTSIITAMLSTCQNDTSKDLFHFFIQTIDQTYCRWFDIITIIVDLKLYDYITLVLQHVDNSKIDMMKIVKNKMNLLSENKLKDLIQNIKMEFLDINYIIWAAFKLGYHEIVTWSIQNDNKNAINKAEVFYSAVFNSNIDVMHYLLKHIDHKLLDIESAVDAACRRGKFDIVEMLVLNVDDDAFDVNVAIDKVFGGITFDTVKTLSDNDNLLDIDIDEVSECARINIVKLMLEKFDHKLFDMTTIMNTAYDQKWFDFIKWVIVEVDDSLLDLNEILSMACQFECLEVVTLLAGKIENSSVDIGAVMKTVFVHGSFNVFRFFIDNIDISLIDLGAAMNEACHNGRSELVKRAIESNHPMIDLNRLIMIACDRNWLDMIKSITLNIGISIFDLNTAMIEACHFRRMNILRWLILNNENTFFDFTTVITDACRDRQIDIVETLIQNVDHNLLGMHDVIDNACRSDNLEQVAWLLRKIDNRVFDMKTTMNNACYKGKPDIMKCLIENVDIKLFDMKETMNKACVWRKLVIVKWLIVNVDIKLFDMKEAMKKSCIEGKLDIVKWLIQNIDNDLFEMTYMKDAMNNACRLGNLDIVKWLISNIDNKLFDMKEAMNDACKPGNLDIVKLLKHNIDNTFFDMKDAMNNACVWGQLDIVKWLIGNFDNKLFDIKEAMNNACIEGKLEVVKWLLMKVDNNLYEMTYMKHAMNNVCRLEYLDIVKWLIENNDNALFEMTYMKDAMNNACRLGNLDIVKWLIDNIDNKLFDMKVAMYKTCKYGNLDIVKWFMENIDNALFDKTGAIEYACVWGKLGILKCLMENVKNKLLAMKVAMNKACVWGHLDIVEWLIVNFDNKLFDMKEALNMACFRGKNIMKWLIKNIDKVDPTCFDLQLSLYTIFNWCDNDTTNLQEIVLMICKQGQKNEIFWTDVLNNAFVFGFLEVLEWLLTNIPSDRFDFDTAIVNALLSKSGSIRYEVISWLIQNVDNNLYDMNVVIEISCRNGWIDIFQQILHLNLDSCNKTVAITQACTTGNVELVKLSLNQFGKENIEFDQVSKTIVKSSKNADLAKFLLQNIDIDNFDNHKVFTAACGFGWIDIIKYIKANASTNCNVSDGMIKACNQGEYKIVLYLLQEFPHDRFDFQSSLLAACAKGWEEIAEILLDTVDHNILHIENNFINICRSSENDIVSMILKKVDHKLLNLNETINTLIKDKKYEQVVINIIRIANKTKLDKQSLIEKAREHRWWKVLAFLNSCI